MVHKCTALFLAWVMTMAIAVSQPGLQYCLCLDEVFVGGCECYELSPCESDQVVGNEKHSHCEAKHTSEFNRQDIVDCSSCAISLSMELGDYVGSDFVHIEKKNGQDIVPLAVQVEKMDFAFSVRKSIHGIRGSPSSRVLASQIPLYISYSVYLI